MLPFEDKAQADIKNEFPNELATCGELLQLALDALGCDPSGNLDVPSTLIPGVGDNARSLALALYTKACKQFRAIIVLGERGFGGEVSILTRSLFETTLALAFVIKDNVTLKRGGKVVNFDPSRPLTTDFRAMLYGAHSALKTESRLKMSMGQPPLQPYAGLLGDPARIAADAAAAENAVGQAWWNQLKQGFSGLKVKDFADSIGVMPYYCLVYGPQSNVVHAGDALRHLDVSDDGSHGFLALAPESDGIGPGLAVAALVFLGCVASLHNRLQFGPEVESRINAFARRLGVPDGS